jgi:hypothetical protein
VFVGEHKADKLCVTWKLGLVVLQLQLDAAWEGEQGKELWRVLGQRRLAHSPVRQRALRARDDPRGETGLVSLLQYTTPWSALETKPDVCTKGVLAVVHRRLHLQQRPQQEKLGRAGDTSMTSPAVHRTHRTKLTRLCRPVKHGDGQGGPAP